MTLRKFAQVKCKAKDVSKKSKKHMTDKNCAALFGLKKESVKKNYYLPRHLLPHANIPNARGFKKNQNGHKNVPPGGSAPHEPITPPTYSIP